MLLEVDLLEVWPPEPQVFLLFALLWVKKQIPLTVPLMSNFYQVGKAVFPLSVPVPVMLLFERNKSFSNTLCLPKVQQSCC